MPEAARAPRAIFLDRDGVINHKPPDGSYVRRWAEFRFLPGVPEALATLAVNGAVLFVVTNQRGVARGHVSAPELTEIHERMATWLASAGAPLAGIYVCPHEADICGCRKPATGLFVQAQRDHPWISFRDADLIGDSLSDLQAGHTLGMRLWLVGLDERRLPVAVHASRHSISIRGTAPSLAALVQDGALLTAYNAT